MEGIQENFFVAEKENAIRSGSDFAYETNFSGSDAMRTAQQFRQSGYRINLIFLGLDSIETAKERVNLRVRKGGHNVSTPEIISRFNDGLSNLAQFIDFFDRAVIFTNVKEQGIIPPRKVNTLQKGQIIEQLLPIPKWLKRTAENLQKLVMKKTQKVHKKRRR